MSEKLVSEMPWDVWEAFMKKFPMPSSSSGELDYYGQAILSAIDNRIPYGQLGGSSDKMRSALERAVKELLSIVPSEELMVLSETNSWYKSPRRALLKERAGLVYCLVPGWSQPRDV